MIDKYQHITEQIQEEEHSYIPHWIRNLSGEKMDDDSGYDAHHALAMCALLTKRISVCMPWAREGNQLWVNQVKEDFQNLIRQVEEYERVPSDCGFAAEAKDLVCIACGMSWQEVGFLKTEGCEPTNLELEVFYIALHVGEILGQYQYPDDAAAVYRNLIHLSDLRYRKDIRLRRAVVMGVLKDILDSRPDCVNEICEQERDIFRSWTEQDGSFYWFWGFSCQRIGYYDQAIEAYERCCRIRQHDTDFGGWYHAIAYTNGCMCRIALDTTDTQALEGLLCYVDAAEAGVYQGAPELACFEIEANALYAAIVSMRPEFDRSRRRRYLTLFETLCRQYDASPDVPVLRLRYAYNSWGAYFMESGDYIQAEEMLRKALEAPFPETEKASLSVTSIQANLLVLYDLQNDIENGLPLALELLEKIDCGEAEELSGSDMFRVIIAVNDMTLNNQMETDDEELEFDWIFLDEACEYFDSLEDVSLFEDEDILHCLCVLSCLGVLIRQDMERVFAQHRYYDLLKMMESAIPLYYSRLSVNCLETRITAGMMAKQAFTQKVNRKRTRFMVKC